MKKARIIKIVSNRYEVLDEDKQRFICVAMGKLRKAKSPVVGDMVEIEHYDDRWAIERVLARKNELIRPSIANVDQAIIVMSAKNPDFSTTLVDRLIFQVVYANIQPILCFTKMDLVEKDDPIYDQIEDYRKSGYALYLSGKGYDDDKLVCALQGKISVLCGQSGAGKSSLLNRIEPSFQLQTQEISKALGRGKHTTRHCELHAVAGGWVGDTPGFSSMDFQYMDIAKLAARIPDFKDYLGMCRFKDCIHEKEPDCYIMKMVEEGKISRIRYQNYVDIVAVIKQRKIKY